MSKQLVLTVALCFGLGLGLGPRLPVAHASKCDIGSLALSLESIEGDADPTAEAASWSTDATIENFDDSSVVHLLLDGSGPSMKLRRL